MISTSRSLWDRCATRKRQATSAAIARGPPEELPIGEFRFTTAAAVVAGTWLGLSHPREKACGVDFDVRVVDGREMPDEIPSPRTNRAPARGGCYKQMCGTHRDRPSSRRTAQAWTQSNPVAELPPARSTEALVEDRAVSSRAP